MLEKKKILVIEEDVFTAKLLASDLEDLAEASAASNWIEAVRLLREERFKLVLVDLEVNDLPDLVQIFDFIHNIDPDYRIIPIFPDKCELDENRYFLMRSGIELALVKNWGRDELRRLVSMAFCE